MFVHTFVDLCFDTLGVQGNTNSRLSGSHRICAVRHSFLYGLAFMALSIFCMNCASAQRVTQPDGSGSQEDPYQITVPGNLAWIATNTNADSNWSRGKNFKLINNIDASETADWNDGEGFVPIGTATESRQFIGDFDGNNKKITNLTINRQGTTISYIGLFGYAGAGSSIHDLALEDASVKGAVNVGVLVGRNDGIVNNCYATGTVRLAYSSDAYSGGLIGVNAGSVYNCYATGSVTDFGQPDSFYIGGLVGRNLDGGAVSYCYAIGSVSDFRGLNVGGLVGQNLDGGTVAYSYYDSQTTGQSDDTGKGTPKTTAEMQTQSTYTGWNFEDIWGSTAAHPYPDLRALNPDVPVTLSGLELE